MTVRRSSATATRLVDGRILIVGGGTKGEENDIDPTSDLYDPQTATFAPAAKTQYWRVGHTATLLSNGGVLIAGGAFLPSVTELYDPSKNAFSLGPLMIHPRNNQTSTAVAESVMLVGRIDYHSSL